MKKRVLITGSNGYIASYVLEELLSHKDVVVSGIDVGQCKNNSKINHYYKCDLGNKDKLKSIIKKIKPNVVIHLAASFSSNFEVAFNINVLNTKNLFDALLSLKNRPSVFVAGSAAEYGLQPNQKAPILESTCPNPINIYSHTKLLQTILSVCFGQTFNFPLVVGRIFNLIGPNIKSDFVIGTIEEQLKDCLSGEKKQITIQNDYSTRDFIDVRDVAKIIWHLVRTNKDTMILNVGSGKPCKIKNILNTLLNKANLSVKIIIKQNCKNKNEVFYSVANNTKLKNLYKKKLTPIDKSLEHIIYTLAPKDKIH